MNLVHGDVQIHSNFAGLLSYVDSISPQTYLLWIWPNQHSLMTPINIVLFNHTEQWYWPNLFNALQSREGLHALHDFYYLSNRFEWFLLCIFYSFFVGSFAKCSWLMCWIKFDIVQLITSWSNAWSIFIFQMWCILMLKHALLN